jgi:hypothetical protein
MLNTFHDPTIYLKKKKKNGTRLMIEKKTRYMKLKQNISENSYLPLNNYN